MSKLFLKRIVRIFIVVLACAFSLMTAEFIFRKTQFTKEFYDKRIDPEPFVYTINKQGFRVISEDVLYDKDNSDYFRIICLGDSFTFGYGVNDDKTCPVFLEKYLEHMWQKKVQVINAGVNGATITEELDIYQEKCSQLQHNLVILLFIEGDICDLFIELLFQGKEKFYEMCFLDKKLYRSKVYSLIKYNVLEKREKYATIHYVGQQQEEVINKYLEKLSALNKIIHSKNAVLVIVVFKSGEEGEKIKNFCVNEGIALMDIRKEYAQMQEKYDIYLVKHHNESGNNLLAEAIANKLISNSLMLGEE